MLKLPRLALGIAMILAPAWALAQDGQRAVQIVVGKDGQIKVLDARTGAEVPSAIIRAHDKPTVVRIVEGPNKIVREISVDPKTGDLIRIKPPMMQMERKDREELQKKLDQALKAADEARKLAEIAQKEAQELAAAEAKARAAAEAARRQAEVVGQEAQQRLAEAQKQFAAAQKNAQQALAKAQKTIDALKKKQEDDAKAQSQKQQQEERERLERLIRDLEKQVKDLADGKKKTIEIFELEIIPGPDGQPKLYKLKQAKPMSLEDKVDLLLREVADLRKEVNDLKKRVDGKKPDGKKSDFDWKQFMPGGWDKQKFKGFPGGEFKMKIEGLDKLDAKDLKEIEDLLKKWGIPADVLKMKMPAKTEVKKTPEAPKPTPATSDLEQRLDRILQEVEALRKEVRKGKAK